jgi:predicted unusual protein kinase regulating ubiquinone biosynthesis (AarF/ABC1/UbiB family)
MNSLEIGGLVMKYEKKWYRMVKVLSFALSVIIQVYSYKIQKKQTADWEKLWAKIGRDFRHMLFNLEGLLIKVGQMLSIRADLLPNSFIDQIKDLVDQVPPSEWEDIKSVLEKEWGGSINDNLSFIEPKAIASASIGEVYRGVLKDGTKIAIKVQRPTIKSIIQTDFRSLSIIIWFAQHFAPVPKGFISFKMLLQELKQVIGRELDFKKEMETAIYFEQRFQSYTYLKIPHVYKELCTSQVLVMEWVEGVRITDLDSLDHYQVNRDELAQRLFRVFIPQWLESGTFHADPHAGNVLVQSDGTLVLLDFGMVGEISKNDAANFQSLLEAILFKNYSKAAEVLVKLGFLLPEANLKIIEKVLADALTLDLTQLKELDLITLKKEMNDIVKTLPIQVPTRFVFLGRSFVTIEGMVHTVSPNQLTLDIVKPAFIDWLNQSETNKWKLVLKWIHSQPIFQLFHSITDLLQKPKQFLELKESQQLREFQFVILENQKKQSFYLGIVGAIGIFAGVYLQTPILWQVSIGVAGLSVLGYLVSSWRQKKWVRRINFKK